MKKLDQKKKTIIFFTIILVIITQASINLYTSFFFEISKDLNCSPKQIKLTLTAFFFGMGIPQLFYGILSDYYGRKKLLLLGLSIFCYACLWTYFSSSYSHLVISRFFQGLGIGVNLTLTRAIIKDSFHGLEYIRNNSYISSAFAISLGLSPVIGGKIAMYFSWQSAFLFLFFWGGALFFLLLIFLPETHRVEQHKTKLRHFFYLNLKKLPGFFKNRAFLFHFLGGFFSFCILNAYTVMSPFLFQKTLGYSSLAYGYFTLLIALSYFIGTITNRTFIYKLGVKKMIQIGIFLIIGAGTSMLFLKLLFNAFNVYVILIPLTVAFFGQSLVWSNASASALKDLGHIAALSSSVLVLFQQILTAVLSGFLAIPKEINQLPLAITITALGLTSLIIFKMSLWKGLKKQKTF